MNPVLLIDTKCSVFEKKLISSHHKISIYQIRDQFRTCRSIESLAHADILIFLLRKQLASRAQIFLAPVLDEDLRGDVNSLCNILDWATTNGTWLINLSIGLDSSEFNINLYRSSLNVCKSGSIIVAACPNRPNAYPQPSSYSFVHAVKFSKLKFFRTVFMREDRFSNFTVYGNLKINDSLRVPRTNSFACAYVSGKLHHSLFG
ncbi:hypothetical protein LT104_10775 [Lacticaseibacillus zeae]|uniref:hypothetical protein n=1 Tax=Lacticaseibacillus zeae TaxID=57037 RepID=UPI00237EEDC7|nr:hypothetical protein [Lacticaseibacillus zeae]MDE3316385.1 hypothetical protein [Lacticaseibacillus zeae]